jgi:hypothetical protein
MWQTHPANERLEVGVRALFQRVDVSSPLIFLPTFGYV